MTHRGLIAALTEDCRVERIKVEDFILALGDLCAEALERDHYFNFGPIGVLRLVPRFVVRGEKQGSKVAVKFYASEKLKSKLKLADVRPEPNSLCEECGERQVRKHRTCARCGQRKTRERKRGEKGARK